MKIIHGTWNDETHSGNYPGIAERAVPLPAAVWLFGSGFLALIGLKRKNLV